MQQEPSCFKKDFISSQFRKPLMQGGVDSKGSPRGSLAGPEADAVPCES
jgi:hypothetical protein